ncbi:hypothetical protein [Microbacterium jiangjiandongii]|uniref:hypothetical protein n=1 Tax=Microbacterium jiangjiandongii TaxID=3049071 RepID=UPI00214B013A|nr:hypothetical protein [Microbacterium sp. zg.Y843]MCR2815805.1 hypothetical protein [Microbacterium sp. zg.Y843]
MIRSPRSASLSTRRLEAFTDGVFANNNARLLFIVLVPFATNLTTEYSEFVAGRLAMPVSFFLAILCSGLQWEWMARHADVMLPEMTTADVVAFGRASRSALIISAVVVAPAPWVGSWAFLLFLLDGVFTRVLRRRAA